MTMTPEVSKAVLAVSKADKAVQKAKGPTALLHATEKYDAAQAALAALLAPTTAES